MATSVFNLGEGSTAVLAADVLSLGSARVRTLCGRGVGSGRCWASACEHGRSPSAEAAGACGWELFSSYKREVYLFCLKCMGKA